MKNILGKWELDKSKIFLLLSLSFIGGIFTASFYYPKVINVFYLALVLIISLIVLVVFYKNKPAVLIGFCVLFFSLGIFLTESKLEKLSGLDQNEKEISGLFVVLKEPQISGNMQRITVGRDNYKISITTFAYPRYFYGDEIKLNCALKIPRSLPAGRQASSSLGGTQDDVFDWQMYLVKDGIFYECQKAKIEKTGENRGNKFFAAFINFKNRLSANVARLIPAPESGLLEGLIVGGDDKLSKNVQDNFSRTGLTHIVAVSGYNVTIIAEYLMILGIFVGLWRKQAFWLAVVGIVLFVFLVGFPSSAVRAGVMGILLIWAIKNGRLANSQNAIIFAAVVMLLINPLLLRWDIGFQLSFLATLGIVYLYPVLEKLLSGREQKFLFPTNTLLEILLLTLSAQIFVLPVILFNFHKLSLISLLANVLVLPIVPLTMLLGFIAVALSFMFFPLAQVFSWLVFLPLKYETTVINYLAGLKYASVETGLTWKGVIIWYILLIVGVYALNKNVAKKNNL